MPPTFLIFIGFLGYMVLMGISLLVGGPMMLFDRTRQNGKLIILTALISFPTLLIVGTILAIIFALPGIGLMFVLDYFKVIPLVGIFLLLFFFIVAISALYHWYLGHMIIKNYLHKRPIDYKIENDKIYSLVIKRIVNYFGLNRNYKRDDI